MLVWLGIFSTLLSGQTDFCASPTYKGIPVHKGRRFTDFPVAHATWVEWLGFDPETQTRPTGPDQMNVAAIRRHIWKLWAELTADSRMTRPDVKGRLPRWETWFSVRDVLSQSAEPTPSRESGTRLPRYEQPPELAGLAGIHARSRQLTYNVPNISQDPLYNQPVCQSVIRNHLGSDSAKACLQELPNHVVPEFDEPTSMALKPIWRVIPSDSPTCPEVPVWDAVPGESKESTQFPEEWPRVIKVRTNPQQQCSGDTYDLDRFYHRKILEASQLGGQDGDTKGYQILVGMHVITKEIKPWVWATFWWHDRALEGRGTFAADRGSVHIKNSVWRNYLMDVAVDMERPWQSDAKPKAVFNPYLEAQMPDGTRSNCMTCHVRASWPSPPRRETFASTGEIGLGKIVVQGYEAALFTYFPEVESALGLRFLWTLARSGNPVPLLLDRSTGDSERKSVPPPCTPLTKLQMR